MRARVENILKRVVGTGGHLDSPDGPDKAYELLILMEIASKLFRTRDFEVEIKLSDGKLTSQSGVPSKFVQRKGVVPVRLPGIAAGDSGPSCVRFRRAGSSNPGWEIWNGIEFLGRSGGRHEFDIAIVPEAAANQIRAYPNGGWPLGHSILIIECKNHTDPGVSDEMRTLIARLVDTTILHWHLPQMPKPRYRIYPVESVDRTDPAKPHFQNIGNGLGGVKGRYDWEYRSTYTALVRSSGFRKGAEELSAHYSIRRKENVTLGSNELRKLTSDVLKWIYLNA